MQSDEAETVHRALLRADLGMFAGDVMASESRTPAAHHRLLLQHLQWVADTPGARLMVMMPPGSAKSTYSSVVFPAWFLARKRVNVIGASHTASLAESFSGLVQRTARDWSDVLGYKLASENVERWRTTNRSQYRSVGVGGAVTGFRADLAVIDDPVKSRQDADSATYRKKVHDWWYADLASRLRPGGRIVLVMTRWHEDDIAGRLLAAERERWKVLKLPALAGENDPLGRAPGAPLWADDAYGYAANVLEQRTSLLAAGKKREWGSLYQQTPTPDDGTVFAVDRLGMVDGLAGVKRSVRGWDLAATDDAGDWTAGALVHELTDGRIVIADVVRFRGGADVVAATIKATAERDGRNVQVSLPQDPGQAGKAQVLFLTRALHGFTVHASVETGDKATRASPMAAQVNVGNVSLLRGAWNTPLIEEMRSFPSGLHDDQVDALARAYNRLFAAPAPARQASINIMAR